MRNVRLYTKSGSIFLIILFGFALILADSEFVAKLKKENRVTARRSPLPLSERLSSQIATFSFFRFEVEGVVTR